MASSPKRGTRKPGGGGPRIDWAAAEIWFFADPGRSLADVAREFGVSDTAVYKHAKSGNWPARRRDMETKARSNAEARVARSREDRIAKVLQVVDLVVDSVFEDLVPAEEGAEPRVRPDYAKLPEFVKLAELLSGEATDRVSFDEMQTALRTVFQVAAKYVPKAKRAEFLAEVNEALGASE